jgi:hypothetical protein
MIRTAIFIGLVIFISSTPGCDALSERLGFEQPEVVSVNPERFESGVPAGTSVRIVFSKDMDSAKTNQAFSLSSESGSVQGYFRWADGRTLMFIPKESLTDNMYTISLTTAAEDSEGNDLKEGIESVFYVNEDLTPPRIISHSPVRNATGIHPAPETDPVLYAGSFIRITFSEAMDIDSLYSGFTISPSVQGLFQWNATHTEVTFDPVYDLDYGTTYTVTLGTSIGDINGNTLREAYVYGFTVGDDFTGPSLTSVYQQDGASTSPPWIEDTDTSGCEKSRDIVLTFSEPVSRESAYDAITISPSGSFHLESPAVSSSITIKLDEPLESETAHTLKVSPSLTDANGNPLDREYRYRFTTDGAGSTRPQISCITDTRLDFVAPYTPGTYDCWAAGDIEPVTAYNAGEYVYILFTKEINPVSINLTAIRAYGSSGSSILKITETDWPNIPPGDFQVYIFSLSGLAGGDTYRLTVRGGSSGLRDSAGNIMKEDYIQYFRAP